MIKVMIENQEEIELRELTRQWVIENIERRHRDGIDKICIRVTIDEPDCHISFSKNCSGGGAAKKNFRKMEREIVHLWERCHMNNDFNISNFFEFLDNLKNYF